MEWIDQIASKYGKSSQLIVLEIFLSHNEPVYQGVALQMNKNKIDLVTRFNQSLNFTQFQIPQKTPVFLLISGKGVLNKHLSAQSIDDVVITSMLSGGQEELFYSQQTVFEDEIYGSISRKDLINEICNNFENEKINLIGCSLGGVSALPTLIHYKISLTSYGRHRFFLSENNIEYNLLNDPLPENFIDVEGMKISSLYLIPYLVGVQYFVDITPYINDSRLLLKWGEKKQKHLFKKILIALSSVIIILLLINSFMFLSFWDKNIKLTDKNQQNNHLLSYKRALVTEVKQKKENLKKAGWLSSSRFSYYADKVTEHVPKTIRLKNLGIFPEDIVKSRENRVQVFQQNRIKLSGSSEKITTIGIWINSLKKEPWLKTIEVDKYKFNKKSKKGEFTLNIVIKN